MSGCGMTFYYCVIMMLIHIYKYIQSLRLTHIYFMINSGIIFIFIELYVYNIAIIRIIYPSRYPLSPRPQQPRALRRGPSEEAADHERPRDAQSPGHCYLLLPKSIRIFGEFLVIILGFLRDLLGFLLTNFGKG